MNARMYDSGKEVVGRDERNHGAAFETESRPVKLATRPGTFRLPDTGRLAILIRALILLLQNLRHNSLARHRVRLDPEKRIIVSPLKRILWMQFVRQLQITRL